MLRRSFPGIPGGYARSGECALRSWSTSLAVTCAAAVSVCSSIAVARAAVSVHREGGVLVFPVRGGFARSGQCVFEKVEFFPVVVARAMVSVCSEVEYLPGGYARSSG